MESLNDFFEAFCLAVGASIVAGLVVAAVGGALIAVAKPLTGDETVGAIWAASIAVAVLVTFGFVLGTRV